MLYARLPGQGKAAFMKKRESFPLQFSVFDCCDLADAVLVTIAFGEGGRQEGIDDVICQFIGDDSCPEADDVGIVVRAGQSGGACFRAAAGTDAFVLVAGDGDADTCTADGDAEVDFFILDGF